MSWKNSTFWFAVQSVKYADGLTGFQKNWSYKKQWEASFAPGRNSVADESAWLNFPALDFLDKHLTREMKIFEFGGGGSTLFFLNRAGFVATVENDGEWFKILKEKVTAKGMNENWEGKFLDGEPVATPNLSRSIANPHDYKSNVKGWENLHFEKYSRHIENYLEGFFDVVLVDGRARPSCILHGIPRVKRGGLLIVDNNERPYYSAYFEKIFAEQFEVLQDGRFPIPYIPDFVRTTILRKK